GISMAIEGKEVTLTATDRFRLAVRTLEWEPTAEEVKTQLLVPAKTLQETARSLDSHITDPIEIAVGTGDSIAADGLFGLHADNRETTTRMLDADFPTVSHLLPKSHTAMASVEIGPLQEALRRVSVLADRNAQIRMLFREGGGRRAAGATGTDNAGEPLPCAFTGRDELLIAVSRAFLKGGLAV